MTRGAEMGGVKSRVITRTGDIPALLDAMRDALRPPKVPPWRRYAIAEGIKERYEVNLWEMVREADREDARTTPKR